MKSQRQLQIGENIKRIISDIFLRDDILTIPGGYITVLEADISPDAKNAKVFIDIFGADKNKLKIVEQLNEAVPHFRFKMAKKLAMRNVPQITFILDQTQENANKIESLITKEGQNYQKNQ